MAEIWRLDDMTVKAIKGLEPGKTATQLNDGGGRFFLCITRHKSKQGVERVSKSWKFFFN